jgi:hypothetical protein
MYVSDPRHFKCNLWGSSHYFLHPYDSTFLLSHYEINESSTYTELTYLRICIDATSKDFMLFPGVSSKCCKSISTGNINNLRGKI